ncbi:hypothetical protein [Sphingomonas sp. SRS2]|uniref:hypothetical protein n=1 Tax=Sphingomonas sp. SRS2 TaxID=133190 RepID=UPI001F43D8B6|nr:hypothetical protein [Sphingomonas sp. SRS2]
MHGLRQNAYGPTGVASPISNNADLGYADSGDVAGCDDCSERDLGYRWATLAAIRSSTECPNDSWGFRRGCLDYTGGV